MHILLPYTSKFWFPFANVYVYRTTETFIICKPYMTVFSKYLISFFVIQIKILERENNWNLLSTRQLLTYQKKKHTHSPLIKLKQLKLPLSRRKICSNKLHFIINIYWQILSPFFYGSFGIYCCRYLESGFCVAFAKNVLTVLKTVKLPNICLNTPNKNQKA